MNKRLKTLLMAGVVTVLAGSSVVSSSALCKNAISNYKTNGGIYLWINGVKYKLPLGNNKPSKDEDSSTEGNTNTDNNQNNNDTNNDNNQDTNTPNVDNDNNEDSNTSNDNDINTDDKNENNDNTNSDNDVNEDNSTDEDENNSVETPSDENNSSDNNQTNTNSFASFQKEVVRLVNVERTKRGLSELTFNSELSNVATIKSQDMINKNYFSHTSPTYGSPFDMMKQFNISYKSAGENIAMGQKTPAEVVTAWMNSQGHRENILSTKFTEIGVGVAQNSNGTLYWTQMFIGK